MGDSDLNVSVIGFGCWEIGGGYGSYVEQEAIAAVGRSLDLGINLYDTALAYGLGQSEELLSRALGKRRSEAIVVTKGGITNLPGRKRPVDGRRQAFMDDIDVSLKALNMDYVDLYLQHWPDKETPIEESMGALVDIQKSGKARYIGISNYHPEQLREAKRHAPIITNQVGYNLFDRRWERQMFAIARELHISVMAYGPMAHGLLTGAFTRDTTFEENDWRRRGMIFGQALFTPDNFPSNIAVVEQLQDVARDCGTTLTPLALGWVLRDPIVAVALSGTRRPQEIEENIKALDVRFTPETVARIDQIMAGAAGQADALPVPNWG
jgi:aryl-alcohol dehydrogenase-like predicted oxidoreductase